MRCTPGSGHLRAGGRWRRCRGVGGISAACEPRRILPSFARPGRVQAPTRPYTVQTSSLRRHCFLTAALASRRVESRVGSGEDSGVTSSGISVHPRTTESHPSSARVANYFLKISERTRGELRIDQFIHDDLVDPLTFLRAWSTIFETCGLQLFRIDRAFHQVPRAQHAQPFEATSTSFVRDFFRNVQPRARGAALEPDQMPDGWCCRGRSESRRRLLPAFRRMKASAPRRPANRWRKCSSCIAPANGYASRPRDDRACRAASRLRERWCDNRARRLPRCKRRCRYVES